MPCGQIAVAWHFPTRLAKRLDLFTPSFFSRPTLFPALFRELISRFTHHQKLAHHCSLFPSQNRPFSLSHEKETMRLLLRYRGLIQCVFVAISMLLGHAYAQSESLPIVTIQSGVPYKTQRQCVQEAINSIGYALNCPYNGGYLESCWCRSDLIPLA